MNDTKSYIKGMRLRWMLFKLRNYKPTEEERIAQIKSFVYGNIKLHNPELTREMVDVAYANQYEDRSE